MKYGEFGRPKLKDLLSSKGDTKASLFLNQFLSAKHSMKIHICFVLYLLSYLPFLGGGGGGGGTPETVFSPHELCSIKFCTKIIDKLA